MDVNLKEAEWLNKPVVWEATETGLSLTTEANTDFWRETHYGFTRDSGHFLGVTVVDGFTASVRVQGEFRSLRSGRSYGAH